MQTQQNRLDEVLARLANGEKLLAHCCTNGCEYPCGYMMRGGKFYLDLQCWCTHAVVAALDGAVRPATVEEINEWATADNRPFGPRLLLYCENRSDWTPYSWREHIGSTQAQAA